MCWVMLFCFPLMAAIQEISARIGRVTGHGIAGNIRAHYPRWLLYAIVGLLLIANIINLGADLGAMGDALQLLIGGPSHLYVVSSRSAASGWKYCPRYERYVAILKWTASCCWPTSRWRWWCTCHGGWCSIAPSCRISR